MNAISKGEIEVKGLDIDSKQGDKRILDYVDIAYKSGEIEIDVSDIPDLVPAISVLAAARKKGEITKIVNAARLRLKESDRLRSVANALNSLGGSVTELNDSLVIEGSERLKGGAIDSYNDHRIVMMGAAASLISDGPVEIEGANAVSKSYPGFFDEYCRLGGEIR